MTRDMMTVSTRAFGEELRCRSASRDDRLHGRAADAALEVEGQDQAPLTASARRIVCGPPQRLPRPDPGRRRAGTIELKIPKLEEAGASGMVGLPGSRGGWPRRHLAAVIQEADIQGVSTGRLKSTRRVQAMGRCRSRASPRARSPGCAARSTIKVNGFLDRPLEGDWPYLWLDVDLS